MARFFSREGPTLSRYKPLVVSSVTGSPCLRKVSMSDTAFSFLLKVPAWIYQRLNSELDFAGLTTGFSVLITVAEVKGFTLAVCLVAPVSVFLTGFLGVPTSASASKVGVGVDFCLDDSVS